MKLKVLLFCIKLMSALSFSVWVLGDEPDFDLFRNLTDEGYLGISGEGVINNGFTGV